MLSRQLVDHPLRRAGCVEAAHAYLAYRRLGAITCSARSGEDTPATPRPKLRRTRQAQHVKQRPQRST
jgi:hypothetical protein